MRVLLTNDDGVDNDGLAALRDVLAEAGDVTVVAPAENQSGVGRRKSYRVAVDEHEWGYVVDGHPVDCVAVGLRGLDVDFDVVVSGCNPGPNVGAHTLGRSGTIGAAVEAAYLGTPGIAVSLYDPEVGVRTFDRSDFSDAAELAARLAEYAAEAGLDEADYLNVNVPAAGHNPEVQLTQPGDGFDVRTEWDGNDVSFEDAFYDPILDNGHNEDRNVAGTDLGALAAGNASVSPLRIGHEPASFDLPESGTGL